MIIFIYYILDSFESSNFFHIFIIEKIKGSYMSSLLIAFGALAFIVIRLVLLIYSETKKFGNKDKKEENAV